MTKRSKASIAARMAANKTAHQFEEQVQGTFAAVPGLIRYSRILALLPMAARAEAERERLAAARCETHGQLEDPAIGLIGKGADQRVAYICPWCSAPAVLAQWEKEGAS